MPRVKPHFKAHVSISHHRLMKEIYPNNDLLALWVRLGTLAVERFATKTNDVVRVHKSELSGLTGGKRRDKAEETLRLLASKLELTLNQDGEYFAIGFRNFSEKQGFTKKNVERMPDARIQIQNTDTTEIGDAHLSDEFVAKLREIRPGGVLYSPEEIRAWFASKHPVMVARGVKNFQRAAINWFTRASGPEVSAACRWVGLKKLDSVRDDRDEREKDSFDDFAKMFGGEDGEQDQRTGEDASGG